MASFGGCCGGRRRSKESREVLAANPVIRGGVQVVYLGAGSIDIVGQATGTTYHVGSRQRHVRVHAADAEAILEHRDFMLRA